MSLHQEILDLFSQNSGDYEPTAQEVEALNSGLEELLSQRIGPTGEEPIVNDPQDQGGLRASLEVELKTKTLKLNFGKPLSFVRMTPEEAREFAKHLYAKAQVLA